MPKKTILIPLDGSAFSRQVIPYVQRHFSPKDHALHLLHVSHASEIDLNMEDAVILSTEPDVFDQIVEEKSKAWFEKQHGSLKTDLCKLRKALGVDYRKLFAAGYAVEAEVHAGDPTKTILTVAKKGPSKLIAMATHGRSGLSHLLMGSVAEQVVRHSTIPVILIRPQTLK